MGRYASQFNRGADNTRKHSKYKLLYYVVSPVYLSISHGIYSLNKYTNHAFIKQGGGRLFWKIQNCMVFCQLHISNHGSSILPNLKNSLFKFAHPWFSKRVLLCKFAERIALHNNRESSCACNSNIFVLFLLSSLSCVKADVRQRLYRINAIILTHKFNNKKSIKSIWVRNLFLGKVELAW